MWRPSGQRVCYDLGDIQQLWRVFCHIAERVAEHALAKRARRSDNLRSRGNQLFGAFQVDPLALFFPEKHLAAAGAATERTLAGAVGVDDVGSAPDDFARLLIYVAIASQVAGIVEHGFFAQGIARRQPLLHARQQLAVVLDLEGAAVLAPVCADGADAMRADGYKLAGFG